MAFSRVCLCGVDDPVDEIYAPGGHRYARAANAAADDDLFHAANDALGNVVGTVGSFAILVFRQYSEFRAADRYQPDE